MSNRCVMFVSRLMPHQLVITWEEASDDLVLNKSKMALSSKCLFPLLGPFL